MKQYTLHYFAARARGEGIRFIFHAADREFDDQRVTDWPKGKATMRFGQMPVLEIREEGKDTRFLTQSIVIARYLGDALALTGADSDERARLDEAVDISNSDIFAGIPAQWVFEGDAEKKAANGKRMRDESHPPKFRALVGAFGSGFPGVKFV